MFKFTRVYSKNFLTFDAIELKTQTQLNEICFKMDYQAHFLHAIDQTKKEARYRIFRELLRNHEFPKTKLIEDNSARDITLWCGVDYLGLSQHPILKKAMVRAVEDFGQVRIDVDHPFGSVFRLFLENHDGNRDQCSDQRDGDQDVQVLDDGADRIERFPESTLWLRGRLAGHVIFQVRSRL